MAKREHPRYENTEWPDYEFREFPMMLYPGSEDGGKTPDRHPTQPGKFLQDPVIVQNEEEARAVLGLAAEGSKKAPEAPTLIDAAGSRGVRRVRTEADDKAAVLEEAEVLGLPVDKSWSIARIQDAIDTHKANPI